MKFKAFCLAFAIPLGLSMQVVQAQPPQAVQEMAEILLSIDKAPTKKQRKRLEDIAASNAVTANEGKLASALAELDGKVTETGKAKVWSVLRDINAGESERELAKIINRFDGKVDKSARARLNSLLPPKPQAKSQKATGNNNKKK